MSKSLWYARSIMAGWLHQPFSILVNSSGSRKVFHYYTLWTASWPWLPTNWTRLLPTNWMRRHRSPKLVLMMLIVPHALPPPPTPTTRREYKDARYPGRRGIEALSFKQCISRKNWFVHSLLVLLKLQHKMSVTCAWRSTEFWIEKRRKTRLLVFPRTMKKTFCALTMGA